MKLIRSLAIASVLALSASPSLAAETHVFQFPTYSMQPTIPKGALIDVLLDDSYRTKPRRFDIVAYKFKDGAFEGQVHVKRVIGLPGEEIEVREKEVLIGGRHLDLPSSVDIEGLALKPIKLKVPADAVFVLGDYTKSSADSRYVGTIPLSQVLGRFVGLTKK